MPPKRPQATESAVKVLAKVRPFSENEVRRTPSPALPLTVQANSIKTGGKTYSFDMCFSGVQGHEQRPRQQDIYAHIGPELVDCAMSGYNASLFAYGQTGSGKTHTMMGPSAPPKVEKHLDDEATRSIDVGGSDAGVIPRFAEDIFATIRDIQDKEEEEGRSKLTSFRVTARYLEVYCEKAYDLLNHGAEVKVRGDGSRLEGITEDVVTNPSSVLQLIKRGNACRTVSATMKNARSSRSHAVFQLVFHQSVVPLQQKGRTDDRSPAPKQPSAEQDAAETVRSLRRSLRASLSQSNHADPASPAEDSGVSPGRRRGGATGTAPKTITSTISLVDLAGSERQKQSGAEGKQFKEMVNINLSLTTLRRVMQVLCDNCRLKPGQTPARPPVRESLLTHALSSSFGGNSKTFIVVNVSPHEDDLGDTNSTFEFSNIARKVVNKVQVNMDGTSAMLKAMEEEIEQLKEALRQAAAANMDGHRHHDPAVVGDSPRLAAANMCNASTMTDDMDTIILQEKLARTEELFGDLESQVENHAHTNIYLVEQIRQKEDIIVALQRQVADVKSFFRTSTEQYFKDRKDITTLLTNLKEPLQKKAGCPQCLAAQTELFVTRSKNAALQEELQLLTSSQEKIYLDMERLRQKHQVTIVQVADLRNTLNVYEDKSMIVLDQRKRIEALELQIQHHLEERVQLTMENHQLRRTVDDMRLHRIGTDSGGSGSEKSSGGTPTAAGTCAGDVGTQQRSSFSEEHPV